ncbi:SDR family NAD(P)-dependent oxidoreductase [Bacillaceae bacterium CLA-AA-H227]|uniref:SDR family NAD(P)-dependent oxidoreductase n=1 Tax=Robertmurraya yapensis (ex Hitch et al 2024) TaxID=3133160 RepID=A0ACC6S9S2_9BACI
MKKALVLGASGGMGYSIVKELSNRGIEVTAFARTKSKLDELFRDDANVTIFQGDIFQIQDLKSAANNVDVIFQAANIPYPEWEEKLETFMGNVLVAAKESKASLAMVDNIYAYGRSGGRKVREDFPKNPHTKKGQIRLNVEALVKNSGVKALIAHFPDFYGPNAENSILHFTLQGVVKNKRAMFVGNQKIKREFIFTPDGAKAIVNLALNEDAYGQNWNIPGSGVISGKELVKLIRDIDNYEKGVTTITKGMIRFLGIFDPFMREVVEMFYLNEEPVVLDGTKYEQFIGELPNTAYRDGLKQTIDYMKKNEL